MSQKHLLPNPPTLIAILLSIILYFYVGYGLERESFLSLIGIYALLFGSFLWIVHALKENFRLLFLLSMAFRLVFLLSIPMLSQDFYRFIWDGKMLLGGNNPYLNTPDTLMQNGTDLFANAPILYENMGALSARHFTNYPPLNQLCFAIAAIFSKEGVLGSVIAMRLMIILADLGIILLGKRILEKLNLPIKNIFWFALNPFIILELTGNLHFEGVLLLFLLWAMYLLWKGRWALAAVAMACSISIKLIPLLFLPVIFRHLGWKKGFVFCALVFVVILLFFLPFFSSEFIHNYSETVGLWFQNFEFNASIYYVLREIGYFFTGYNQIAFIGKVLPVFVFLGVCYLSFKKQNEDFPTMLKTMLFSICLYFLLSTTVHPWYLATPLLLSVFTRFRFPIVWSLVVILSYFAYSQVGFKESYPLLALEYGLVFLCMGYESRKGIVNG